MLTRTKRILQMAKTSATSAQNDFSSAVVKACGSSPQEKSSSIADAPFEKVSPKPVATVIPTILKNLNFNTTIISTNVSQNSNALDENESSFSEEDPFIDSGSEYQPSENDSVVLETDLDTEEENQSVTNLDKSMSDDDIKIAIQQPIVFNNFEDYNKTREKDSENLIFLNSAKRNNGKLIRDKGHACFFCHKIVVNNLARHLEKNHSNEIEVARILAMPKGSKVRRDAFLNLTRCGDFYSNCDTLSTKKGELILARRPSPRELQVFSYNDYGPCPECLGFMVKRHIWHHLKYNCQANQRKQPEDGPVLAKHLPVAESNALLNGILGAHLTSDYINNVINKFKNDEISLKVKEDSTIMGYGAFLFEKYSSTQAELIRQSMRQLGRLMLELQDKEVQSLGDILVPNKFDVVVEATKKICLLTAEPTCRPEFKTPSLALKIGYALKKCASIKRGQCLRKGDLKGDKLSLAFLELMNLEWQVRISSNALATLYKRKKNAADLLPLTSDLVKLSTLIDKKMKEIKAQWDINCSAQNWQQLASLTLTRIILFNKRRSGEAAKMTLTQYSTRPEWNETGTQEMKSTLTALETKLASSLTVVNIVGKRGTIVPVILTTPMKESIDLLVKSRVKQGILTQNPYIFAVANTDSSHMRGYSCLKTWCDVAELKRPQLVTSTKLRKYVATVCQVFNLSENEYDWLARHLGHNIKVHREFYRLQENAVELTKISRLLLAVDQGQAHKYNGKELKDINVEDLSMVEDDDEMEDTNEITESVKVIQDIDNLSNNENLLEDNLQQSDNSKKGNQRKSKELKQKKRAPCTKKPWSNEEKEILLQKFRVFVRTKSLPGKEKCLELMEKYPVLSSRKWTDLKFFIKNYIARIHKKTND